MTTMTDFRRIADHRVFVVAAIQSQSPMTLVCCKQSFPPSPDELSESAHFLGMRPGVVNAGVGGRTVKNPP